MSENVEASTGIEPVYTDLQSAASPLRQLAEVEFHLGVLGGGVKLLLEASRGVR